VSGGEFSGFGHHQNSGSLMLLDAVVVVSRRLNDVVIMSSAAYFAVGSITATQRWKGISQLEEIVSGFCFFCCPSGR
jgi:hypothetical protein